MTTYVASSRLLSHLRSARLGVVEAAGGYGKTSLAAQFRASLPISSAAIELGQTGHDPLALATALTRGLRRVKLAGPGQPRSRRDAPDDVIDAVLQTLEDCAAPILLTVDDAHVLDAAGRRLLVRLAGELPRPHRLLILSRSLGDFRRQLQPDKQQCSLTGADLQFTEHEIRAIFEDRLGQPLLDAELRMIMSVTAGWPAAVVRCAGDCMESRSLSERVLRDVVAALLHERLAELGTVSRRAVTQLAHLPWFSRELVESVAGAPALLDEMTSAGLPMLEDEGPRVTFPTPVREHLAALAPLRRSTTTRVAAAYASLDAVDVALDVLMGAGNGSAAAKLLAELPPYRVERLGYVELRTASNLLPPEAVRAHPRVLLHVVRRAELALDLDTHAAALSRIEAIAEDLADAPLQREAWAERARELLRDNRPRDAESLALRALREANPDELRVRARSLETLARVQARAVWDAASLQGAESSFVEATILARWAGEATWAAEALFGAACNVHFVRGEIDAMLARLAEALALVQTPHRLRAVILIGRARGLIYLGRYALAEQDLAEADQLGVLYRDARILADAALERARIASQLGDPARTASALGEAEHQLGAVAGSTDRAGFLADAALLLDRVGDAAGAAELFRRARGESGADQDALRVAEALLLARSGDARAEDRFEALAASHRSLPRERWRINLFRAYAAERRDDPAAATWAVAAFDTAESLGLPLTPLIQEQALTERLVAIAAEAGSHAAASLPVENLPLSIFVLGRFAVVRGGVRVPLPSGLPERLVKFLAVRGGRAHVEEAVEALWPYVSPGSGRKRLRNVLNRLRETGTELVVRESEMLSLAERIEVDAQLFEADAKRALNGVNGHNGANGANGATGGNGRNGYGDPVAAAELALARYGGDLLPDDVYESWADGPRERLRLRRLSLLDLLAVAARARGDSEGELMALERSIEVDPQDLGRYVTAAHVLRAQGKRLAAYGMLMRGQKALAAADLQAPNEFAELALELQRDLAGQRKPVPQR